MAITSGVMPVPVSVTQSDTYWPGVSSRSRAARVDPASCCAVSIVSRPPSGMASRALMQRFSSAFSSWLGSTSVGHRPGAADDLDRDRRPDGAADQILHAARPGG